jgi:hypothetical protein
MPRRVVRVCPDVERCEAGPLRGREATGRWLKASPKDRCRLVGGNSATLDTVGVTLADATVEVTQSQ